MGNDYAPRNGISTGLDLDRQLGQVSGRNREF